MLKTHIFGATKKKCYIFLILYSDEFYWGTQMAWNDSRHYAWHREQLAKEMTTAYVGIDPTADSLHIGHLVSLWSYHFQRCGHRPVVLVWCNRNDWRPSGKSQEPLAWRGTLRHNQECLKETTITFSRFRIQEANAPLWWITTIGEGFFVPSFIRDIGKHITVNYMRARTPWKKRKAESSAGMSFTEFTYQLVQGTDFLHLYQALNCNCKWAARTNGQHYYWNWINPRNLVAKHLH
jgi:tyrosyl-tRNA synthetase